MMDKTLNNQQILTSFTNEFSKEAFIGQIGSSLSRLGVKYFPKVIKYSKGLFKSLKSKVNAAKPNVVKPIGISPPEQIASSATKMHAATPNVSTNATLLTSNKVNVATPKMNKITMGSNSKQSTEIISKPLELENADVLQKAKKIKRTKRKSVAGENFSTEVGAEAGINPLTKGEKFKLHHPYANAFMGDIKSAPLSIGGTALATTVYTGSQMPRPLRTSASSYGY
jgi:hypothetical protein